MLTQQLQALEHQLHKERRERAAMEEALTSAYSTTLKEIVRAHESEVAEAAAASCSSGSAATTASSSGPATGSGTARAGTRRGKF